MITSLYITEGKKLKPLRDKVKSILKFNKLEDALKKCGIVNIKIDGEDVIYIDGTAGDWITFKGKYDGKEIYGVRSKEFGIFDINSKLIKKADYK